MKEGLRVKQRGGEIKSAIDRNKGLAEGYSIIEGQWGRDSELASFAATFFHCLPELIPERKGIITHEEAGQILKRYIENILSKNHKEDMPMTAVELGGPGSRLFRGFSENFFTKTVGVCLKDIRSEKQKIEDDKAGHHIISGAGVDILDIKNPRYLDLIRTNLGTDKTNLIISRMMAPLKHISKDKAVLDRTIRNWYGLLEHNGLLFVQFQTEDEAKKGNGLEEIIREWAEAVEKRFPEIEIQVGYKALRIHKKAGAPEKLPPATQLFS